MLAYIAYHLSLHIGLILSKLLPRTREAAKEQHLLELSGGNEMAELVVRMVDRVCKSIQVCWPISSLVKHSMRRELTDTTLHAGQYIKFQSLTVSGTPMLHFMRLIVYAGTSCGAGPAVVNLLTGDLVAVKAC